VSFFPVALNKFSREKTWNLVSPRLPRLPRSEATRIKPEPATAHSNLENALRDQGKAEKAIAEYLTAIPLLLPPRRHNRQNPHHEAAPLGAVGSACCARSVC